ncbi:Dph6-related ATP pyrophosphatase [Roseivirga misakiensis]|uniref:ATP-binding protein n=1 Tax=Roseivirga misakiensis TaxID=1563681 RepID=A0A1E5T5P3_9BACT|nr:diphthine--ammonia ligase [Roseivirga misakiensis]OEK06701.1 ATP-binding protein [Roseivirga misakiensis]
MKKQAIFNWSGGKDSALALYHTLNNHAFEIRELITTVNADLERISMHGVRKSMLQKQVQAIGLPLSIISLPTDIDMASYDAVMKKELSLLREKGVTHSIFGDIFLEDLKNYRVERLKEVGLEGNFPLWKRDTNELIQEFLSLGFKTLVVAIDGSKLDKSFAGRVLDEDFLNDLPENVDPCGENGEFHTFVFDGPIFKAPVKFEKGEVVGKAYELSKGNPENTVTYWFQDLM